MVLKEGGIESAYCTSKEKHSLNIQQHPLIMKTEVCGSDVISKQI